MAGRCEPQALIESDRWSIISDDLEPDDGHIERSRPLDHCARELIADALTARDWVDPHA